MIYIYIYDPLILTKVPRKFNGPGITGSLCKMMSLNTSYFTQIFIQNRSQINLKAKTIQILEENIGKKL